MADKKTETIVSEEKSLVAYTMGVISIVLAFFTPLAGLVFSIIGLVQAKKNASELGKKARKLNIIGLVLSIILFIISVILMFLAIKNGTTNPLTGLAGLS